MDLKTSKIKVGIMADGLERKAMGSAIYLRNIIEQYLADFGDEIDLYLIYKEGQCQHELCGRAKSVSVKILSLPKFAGFFSYLWLFVSTKNKFDIIHFSRPALHPFFWLLKVFGKTKKIVVTFHGAPDNASIPIFQTFATRFNRWFIISFGRFFIDAALADSETAINQIAWYYKFPKNKIHSVYLGIGKEFLLASDKNILKKKLLEKYKINFPYILGMGRMDPHKNTHRLLEAFFKLKKEGLPHELIIIGGEHEPEYSNLIKEILNGSEYKQAVKFIDFADDEDLPAFYSLADVFAFPSLSEGFGLPVLEAMACGTPVVTSNASCLPEIAGGAAVLADPYQIGGIADAIRLAIKDINLKRELVLKGIKRSGDFSWKKTAEGNFRLYKSVLTL
ncbi:MAG: glycosyltransferase family 1 protein [Candidatus Pacebacteria bacterium]|nr:glycosyltransferase family 1 protein [Candidatus Paceibacterota bacterium]